MSHWGDYNVSERIVTDVSLSQNYKNTISKRKPWGVKQNMERKWVREGHVRGETKTEGHRNEKENIKHAIELDGYLLLFIMNVLLKEHLRKNLPASKT